MYGNSGLAARTPATADAAGKSNPPLLWADDLLDLDGGLFVSTLTVPSFLLLQNKI